MSMNIKVNGTRIKQPLNPSISHYNLTKAGRVASGRMTMELIAKKKKLFINYSILSGRDLAQILSLIDGPDLFFDVSYDANGSTRTFRGYVGEINFTEQRSGPISGYYWKDVSFNFIEQ